MPILCVSELSLVGAFAPSPKVKLLGTDIVLIWYEEFADVAVVGVGVRKVVQGSGVVDFRQAIPPLPPLKLLRPGCNLDAETSFKIFIFVRDRCPPLLCAGEVQGWLK
ncbi:hypothetical protein PV326_000182, partial [Microctonus aethiopoides]